MKLKVIKAPCPVCHGLGYIEYIGHYSDPDETECYNCDGKGWVHTFEKESHER